MPGKGSRTAFVFPGQGAQKVGMGKAIAEAWPAAKAVFESVDEALDERLSALIWDGDIETLTLTANAQPALMVTSMATFAAMEAEGLPNWLPDLVAGHSLGEYSALCAMGALTLADTARLLRIRGQAMQDAVPPGEGAMAAILGADLGSVRRLAAAAAGDLVCQVANDNDPTQVVVSGHRPAVERAAAMAQDHGARRAVMLPVSAPFHCALMKPAAERMEAALRDVPIRVPRVPVVANVTAAPVDDPECIRRLLLDQVTAPVRWRESILRMRTEGVGRVCEFGPGATLSGMIRRIDRNLTSRAIQSVTDVAETLEVLTVHGRSGTE